MLRGAWIDKVRDKYVVIAYHDKTGKMKIEWFDKWIEAYRRMIEINDK